MAEVKTLRFLVMDVDGTLTDGKIYMSNTGELFKAFDIKDGCGIKDILPQHNVTPVIITARESELLSLRCKELGVEEIHQGVRDKIRKLDEIIEKYSAADKNQYSYSNVAYIGDDILDLQCMNPIKAAGGIVGCPDDAVKEVVSIADFVSSKKGGEGAVREFIEWIINAQ